MNYRSLADMNDTILRNVHRLPRDIDVVVGIPRSGLLAANLLCLALNVPMADADGFLEGRILSTGHTTKGRTWGKTEDQIHNVLVVDDSIKSGQSMQKVRTQFASLEKKYNILYCAIYGDREQNTCDIVFETVKSPRMFQ